MVDREKVISGLHCCSHTDGANCMYCPYDIRNTDCTALMAMDVLDLLKEQEPIVVKECKVNKCVCGNEINRYWHPEYCGFCGKKLEWY